MILFGLISLFNGISNLRWLINAKAIFVEQRGYNLIYRWGDKGVHTYPTGISPKVNIIARLVVELVYFKDAVQHFSHYATKTTHPYF